MNDFRLTRKACYIGYIVQAVVNNYTPLLFVTFLGSFPITLGKLAVLSAFNFMTQLLVDMITAKFADRIGYRTCLAAAHFSSAIGMAGYAILPFVLPSAFAGLLLSTFLCAIGGGMIEVLISPTIEHCPAENKTGSMSLLHSFYCWGQAGVVLLSTLYFSFVGIENWRLLSVLWGIIPLLNGILFSFVNLPQIKEENAPSMSLRELLRQNLFPVLLLLMVCSGASELGISQWVSAFAEKGLHLSKSLGDLAGSFLFAIAMGTVRALYGIISQKVDHIRFLTFCSLGCVAGYLLASLSPSPFVGLLGCLLCGLSVALFWPGTLSISAEAFPAGGTLMFGLLALSGDLGCTAASYSVGAISAAFSDNLRAGIGCSTVFPILMTLGLLYVMRRRKR